MKESGKANAIYVMGGGGTAVISASAYGLVNNAYKNYRDKIGTVYAAVGGMRGALNEDLVDVFKWLEQEGSARVENRLNMLKFPSSPVFGTSRVKPDVEDCQRLFALCKAKNIKYIFLNGGNDTMEKAMILGEFAVQENHPLKVIGIPKTVDNDLLITHRCPGYTSFAKQVAINTMSLQSDLDAFGLQKKVVHGGPIKEGAVAQVCVFMGRDEGWGAAATVVGKLDESYGPHVILTKEGGFNKDKFLSRCQNAWDRYGNLLVVASEGAHNGDQYIGNELEVLSYKHQMLFKIHRDPHKNTSVTDSRLALFLKLLLENNLKIPTDVYKGFKVREEGPAYLNRNNYEILSAVDFYDAIAVGHKAADLAIDRDMGDIMITLTSKMGETSYIDLGSVASTRTGSRGMTKSLSTLDTAEKQILSPDGMMINRELYLDYIWEFLDLNGPNRRELLAREGFRLPLPRIEWPLEDRVLPVYKKAIK